MKKNFFTLIFLILSIITFSALENYKKGIDYYNKEDYKNAEIYLLKAVKEKDPEAYFTLGTIYDRQKKYSQSEKYYKLALENDTTMKNMADKINNILGIVYLKDKKYSLAEES